MLTYATGAGLSTHRAREVLVDGLDEDGRWDGPHGMYGALA